MTTNLSKLLSVRVYHTYFSNGFFRNINYKAGETTGVLMQSNELKLVHTNEGFDLYSNTQTPIHEYLEYLSETTGARFFEFDVIPRHANFFNITDYPIEQIGHFQFDSSSIVLRGASNLMEPEFIETSEWSRAANIKIRFKDILDLPGPESNGLNFSINFKAKATQWRYYIIPGSRIRLNNPHIKTDSAITFEPAQEVQLTNGENAFLISSGDLLIALSERPVNRFTLVDTLNSNPDVGVEGQSREITVLPSAGVNALEKVSIDDHIQMVSPIYVYL